MNIFKPFLNWEKSKEIEYGLIEFYRPLFLLENIIYFFFFFYKKIHFDLIPKQNYFSFHSIPYEQERTRERYKYLVHFN